MKLIKTRIMVNSIKELLERAIITAIQASVRIMCLPAGSKDTHTHTTKQP